MKRFILAILLVLTMLSPAGAYTLYQRDIILTGTGGVWSDSRSYTNLTLAVAAMTGNERDLYIARNESVTTLTIPSTLRLHFLKDGAITPTGTLTINTKSIEAGDRQIFYGTGTVDFADGSEVRSTWFSDAREAIAETANDEVVLTVAESAWVTSNVSVGNKVALKFEAPGNELVVSPGVTLSNVGDVTAGGYVCFKGSGLVDFADGVKIKSSWFNRFEYGIRHIDDSIVELEVSESDTIYNNTAVHANTALDFRRGAVLTISLGMILSGVSDITAGDYSCFAGTGRVDFIDGASLRSSWFSSLSETIRHIDDSIVRLTLSESETITTNVTAPPGITFVPRSGILLTVTAGDTLIIRGPVIASRQQLFAGAGTVAVNHDVRSYAEWWGNATTTFWVDAGAADQGAASITGDRTVKDVVDAVLTRNVEIVFLHTDAADTTPYTFSTSETIPSNITCVFQPGAILVPDAGITVTVASPEHIIASPRQQIIDTTINSTDPLEFTRPGIAYVDWLGASPDASGTLNKSSLDILIAAFAITNGSVIRFNGGNYSMAPEITPTTNTNLTIEGVGGRYFNYGANAFGTTTLIFTSGTYGFDLTGRLTGLGGFALQHLKIDGTDALANGIIMQGNTHIKDVVVMRCTNAGIWSEDYANTELIRDVLVYGNGYGFLLEGGFSTLRTIQDVIIRGNTLAGIRHTGGPVWANNLLVEAQTIVGIEFYQKDANSAPSGQYKNVFMEANGRPTVGGTDGVNSDHAGPTYVFTSVTGGLTGATSVHITSTGSGGHGVVGTYIVSSVTNDNTVELTSDPTDGTNETAMGWSYYGADDGYQITSDSYAIGVGNVPRGIKFDRLSMTIADGRKGINIIKGAYFEFIHASRSGGHPDYRVTLDGSNSHYITFKNSHTLGQLGGSYGNRSWSQEVETSVAGGGPVWDAPLNAPQAKLTTRLAVGSATMEAGVETVGVAGATTIYTAGNANDYVAVFVGGFQGANGFMDLVMGISNIDSPQAVSAITLNGAPAARTYTFSGLNLQLEMASDTYTIRVIPFGSVP